MSDFIKLGLITTKRKINKPQIHFIINLLNAYGEFRASIIEIQRYTDKPFTDIPIFDVIIPYHLEKEHFPIIKQYTKLYNPLVFNDIEMQENILSRKFINETLIKNNIPCLDFIAYNHTAKNTYEFIEGEDFIEVNGKRIDKPFVEKPVSVTGHDIYIYCSSQTGGGVRKLCRKQSEKWSEYSSEINTVRKDGEYVYERLLENNNAIKIYSVLGKYSYAQSTMSPIFANKKEECNKVREDCILNPEEDKVASKIISVFKQNVCGFDIVREAEHFYVIDVNGMSFVKNNNAHNVVMAHLVRRFVMKRLWERNHSFYSEREETRKKIPCASGNKDNFKGDMLLGAIALYRHGDRTPKIKIKIRTSKESLVELLKKLRKPSNVFIKEQDYLACIRFTLEEILIDPSDVNYKKFKLAHRALKYSPESTKVKAKLYRDRNNTQMLKMTIKSGGVLTEIGKMQCQSYARNFEKAFTKVEGFGGIVSNVCTYSRNESRVYDSAKIFLNVLAEINCQKITSTTVLKDPENIFDISNKKSAMEVDNVFNRFEFDKNYENGFDLEESSQLVKKLYNRLRNPSKRMEEIRKQIDQVVAKIEHEIGRNPEYAKNGEGIQEIHKRWKKVRTEFDADGNFKTSVASEMYDYLRCDLKHHFWMFGEFREMYDNLKTVCEFAKLANSGKNSKEKLNKSKEMSQKMINKFLGQLQEMKSGENKHKLYLYFASEISLFLLRNFFISINLGDNSTVKEAFEKIFFNFMGHQIIRLYEDLSKGKDDPMRFYINIGYSSGIWADPYAKAGLWGPSRIYPKILVPFVGKMSFEGFLEKVMKGLE